VAGCDNRDGGRVAQWGWIGFLPNNDCQRWQSAPTAGGWTRIRSVLPGARVWDVSRCAGGTTDDIVVNTQGGASCQEFRFEPVGPVLLVDPNASPASARRRWRFTSVGGAEYTIADAVTGHRLGTRWTLVPDNDGTWTLAEVGTSVTRTVRLLNP
jgi:arabinan endo-1,5-alpha-L-arabinosidase